MIRALLLSIVLLTGCSDLERDNPLDLRSSHFVDLPQLLIGSWARNDQERNEVFFFKVDGAFQLLDFTCYQRSPGDQVDYNTVIPCYTFSGIYSLAGDQLDLFFQRVDPKPDQAPVPLPRTDKLARISIRRQTLTLVEEDGTRSYTRL